MVCVQSRHFKNCLSPCFMEHIKALAAAKVGILLWLDWNFSCYQLQRIQSVIQTRARLQIKL